MFLIQARKGGRNRLGWHTVIVQLENINYPHSSKICVIHSEEECILLSHSIFQCLNILCLVMQLNVKQHSMKPTTEHDTNSIYTSLFHNTFSYPYWCCPASLQIGYKKNFDNSVAPNNPTNKIKHMVFKHISLISFNGYEWN